jgi:hypothetical protein
MANPEPTPTPTPQPVTDPMADAANLIKSWLGGGYKAGKIPTTLEEYFTEAFYFIDRMEAEAAYTHEEAEYARNSLKALRLRVADKLPVIAGTLGTNADLPEARLKAPIATLAASGISNFDLPFYNEVMSETDYPSKIAVKQAQTVKETNKKAAEDLKTQTEALIEQQNKWYEDQKVRRLHGQMEAGRSQEYADRLNAPFRAEQAAKGGALAETARENTLTAGFKEQERLAAEEAKEQSIITRMGIPQTPEQVYAESIKGMPWGMKRFYATKGAGVTANFDDALRSRWWDSIYQMTRDKMNETYEGGAASKQAAGNLGIPMSDVERFSANPNIAELGTVSSADRGQLGAAQREYENWAQATNTPMKLPEDPLKKYLNQYAFLDEYLGTPRSSRGLYPGRQAPLARWA